MKGRLQSSTRQLLFCRVRSELRTIYAALIATLFICAVPSVRAEELISQKHLQSDITETYDLLKKYHPNLTAHKSRKELDVLYQRLLNSAPGQNTKWQAYLALSELVGAVCDEHTEVFIQENDRILRPDGWPWYEYPLIVKDGRLYLQQPHMDGTEEIITVNGVGGADIALSLSKRSSFDGCLDQDTLLVTDGLGVNGAIVGAMIGHSGPYMVKTRRLGVNTQTEHVVRAAGRLISSMHRQHFTKKQTNDLESFMRSEGFLQQRLGPEVSFAQLDYRYAPSRNLAYLGIERFDRFETATKGIELVMRDIIKKNPDALIIDLVDNPGGATDTAQPADGFPVTQGSSHSQQGLCKKCNQKTPVKFRLFR